MAQGLRSDHSTIRGLKESLLDNDCPVYTQDFYPDFKEKILGGISLYNSGDAFIYIPKMPFSGGAETYNFLYSSSIWDMDQSTGLISPKRSITIINENDRFS